VTDVKCEKYHKAISLYLDGRLDEAGERELRDHVWHCPRCAKMLAALESGEKSARATEATEPKPSYWDTFSSRVMEKIDAREEAPAGFGLKRLMGMIVPTPGHRLRVAAGLVSLAVVIAVGVLYVEHRGERVLPPGVSLPVEREKPGEEAREVAGVEQPARATEGVVEPKKTEDAARTLETGAAPRKIQTETARATGKKAAAPPSPPSQANELVPAETKGKDEEKAPAVYTEAVKSAEKTNEKTTESSTETSAEKPAVTQRPTQALAVGERTVEEQKGHPLAEARTRAELAPPMRFYVVDGTRLQRITDTDTLVGIDELRTLIATWKNYIEKNPTDGSAPRQEGAQTLLNASPGNTRVRTDSLTNEGYRQVASAYCLLARQSRNADVVSEGARTIKTYLDRAEDPAVKEFLAAKLEELEKSRK
jgi:hypothetical protein